MFYHRVSDSPQRQRTVDGDVGRVNVRRASSPSNNLFVDLPGRSLLQIRPIIVSKTNWSDKVRFHANQFDNYIRNEGRQMLAKTCTRLDLDLIELESNGNGETHYKFWTSRPARMIYLNIWLALAFRQAWFLYGVLLIVLTQVVWVALQWYWFIVDDPKLWAFVQFAKQCIRVVLREGEGMFNDGNVAQLLMVGAVLFTGPTSVQMVRMHVRYKMSRDHVEFLQQLKNRGYSLPDPPKLLNLTRMLPQSSKLFNGMLPDPPKLLDRM